MTSPTLLRVWLSSLLVLAATTPLALAQSQATTGVIEGIALDSSGAVLPGVSVSLLNTAINYEKTQVTDASGRFRAVLLPLGPYRVAASLDGFATLVQEGLQLTVGATLRVNLQMQIKAQEEEIVVQAEVPLVEISSPQNAVRIDRETIEGLPNNGRNFLDLTRLTPGVAIVQVPTARS
jgi:hypothetical protein